MVGRYSISELETIQPDVWGELKTVDVAQFTLFFSYFEVRELQEKMWTADIKLLDCSLVGHFCGWPWIGPPGTIPRTGWEAKMQGWEGKGVMCLESILFVTLLFWTVLLEGVITECLDDDVTGGKLSSCHIIVWSPGSLSPEPNLSRRKSLTNSCLWVAESP